ncbi:hypothetical protein HYT18_03910 [Candidatus Microgenomates bacterium]|nr:hypothetical protein [Candidatus Microgenomates bacterium]
MDLLSFALIFLIALLTIFLTITGVQVFFILRDLKKALDRLNKVLQTSDEIAEDLEKPAHAAANLVTTLSAGAKALTGMGKKDSKPKPKRFYKKTL